MNLLNGTSSFKKTQTHNSDMCSILVIYDYLYWGTHSVLFLFPVSFGWRDVVFNKVLY